MLKTTKWILTGVGVSAAGTGIYFVLNHYLETPKKNQAVKHSTKYYDTIPERDSSLDRLNKILKDNQDGASNTPPVSPISVEVYENIDRNSRLYDSLVQAGYIERVEDENVVHHNEKFENGQSIKGDRFLLKRMVRIMGKEKKNGDKDSLMSALAEIKPAGSKMAIEFWESPVNYKGYRLGRDKMIVFGVIPDEVKVVKYNGHLYLVTINNIFEVNPCTDFCQLRPIKDKTLLENIMQNAH